MAWSAGRGTDGDFEPSQDVLRDLVGRMRARPRQGTSGERGESSRVVQKPTQDVSTSKAWQVRELIRLGKDKEYVIQYAINVLGLSRALARTYYKVNGEKVAAGIN